jgi:hypothetical protein
MQGAAVPILMLAHVKGPKFSKAGNSFFFHGPSMVKH